MLEFLMRIFYKNVIYTDEPKLFYKIYKWNSGLHTFIMLFEKLVLIIFGLIAFVCSIFVKNITIVIILSVIFFIISILEILESKKRIEYNIMGLRTPGQIRIIKLKDFLKKFISLNGKALGRKEWEEIKKTDKGLYNDLLSDECEGACYFYSLDIALIIKDSILIWGGIDDPFIEGHNHYAHAVILRNGHIYDSNMYQSIKYEDFLKLYKFKTYKQWNYEQYSKKDFRDCERTEFRKWCKENNVLEYEKF